MKNLQRAAEEYNKRTDDANLGAKIFLLMRNIEKIESSEAVNFIRNELPRETLQNPEYLDTIIKYALNRGDADIFQALVDAALDINYVDRRGNSVMDRAIASGYDAIINIITNVLAESIWDIDSEDNIAVATPVVEAVIDHESPYNLLMNQAAELLSQNITSGGVVLTPENQETIVFSGGIDIVVVDMANQILRSHAITGAEGQVITSLAGLSSETVQALSELCTMKLDSL